MSRKSPKPSKPSTEATPEPQNVVARFQQVLADVERGALSLSELDRLKDSLQSWSRRLDVAGLSERLSALRTGRKPEVGAHRPAAAPVKLAKPVRATKSDPATWAPAAGGGSFASTTTTREDERMRLAHTWYGNPAEAQTALAALEQYDELQARGSNLKASAEAFARKAVNDARAQHDRETLSRREWAEHSREQAALAAKREEELRVRAEAESRVRAAQERVAAAQAEQAEALERLKNR